MLTEQELRTWARECFEEGCYLGDLVRSEEEWTEEERFHVEMALEGFLVGRLYESMVARP